MAKLGELRVDFVGNSKDLEIAAAKAKTSLAGVGAATTAVGQKQVRAGGNALRFGSSLGSIGQKAGLAKGGLRNMTFQLQDIIVQMQMGTRMSTIMSQQLPQLGASFGSVGLIIFSVVGALAAVGGLMLATSGDSATLEEHIESLGEKLDDYVKSAGDVNLSTGDMIEKFGSASAAVREVLAELTKLDGAATAAQINTMIDALVGFAEVEDRINASLLAQKLGLTTFFSPFIALTKETKGEVISLAQAYADFANATESSEKVNAARALLSQFTAMAEKVGGINAEEEEQIRALAEIILKLEKAETVTESLKEETARASEFMDTYATKTAAMAKSMGDAKREAEALTIAQMNLNNLTSGLVGGGRGGAPTGGKTGVFVPPKKGAKGGAGKVSPLERDLDRLRDNLATEIELEMEHFKRQEEILAEALASKKIKQDEFDQLAERSKKQHNDRMDDLDKTSKKNQIHAAGEILGALGGLMNSGSKKLFKIGKAAAMANALVSTYEGIAKAVGSAPFPFNVPAIAFASAKGFGAVAAIQSQQFNGGGGGGAASAGAASAGGGGAAQQSSFFNVNLQGEGNIGQGSVRDLIGQINDAIDDGAVLRGITVN